MKLKAAVLVVIPVLLIAAAALFYWYVRGQSQPPIVIDDPVPVSSQPIEQTQPIENIVIPEITVPAPDITMPTQGDALTPETVLPDPAPTPEDEPDVKDDKQPTSPPKDTPKGGETNEKGQKWFPGFGWVDDEGAGTHDTANMNPNGNIVGY